VSDLGAARHQLDVDLLELEQALTPESLGERLVTAAKRFYLNADGGVNVKRVAITAGVLVGFVILRSIK
jgi:hypothetical protein